MPTQDDIIHQQVLLQSHRQTLAHFLHQQAILSTAFAPPNVTAGIKQCRADIFRVKQTLRKWNIDVEDLPDEEIEDVQIACSSTKIIPAHPYEQFHRDFREVIAYKRYEPTGSILHVVFGNIANLQATTVVLPVSQSFDLRQRNPRSALGSFEKIIVNNMSFFSAIEEIWPSERRVRYAGIGHSHFLRLPDNSQSLEGVMFTVTTRDLSDNPAHYGRYVDTPLDGIDYILDKVIECAVEENIQSIAIPLLGTGFANIRRIADNPQLDRSIKQAVLGLIIYKLERQLVQVNSKLRRGIVVLYSSRPNSEEENTFWQFLVKFIKLNEQEKLARINDFLETIDKSH